MSIAPKYLFKETPKLTTTMTTEAVCNSLEMLQLNSLEILDPYAKVPDNQPPSTNHVLDTDWHLDWHPRNHREYLEFLRAKRNRRRLEGSNMKETPEEEARHLQLTVRKAGLYLQRNMKNSKSLLNMLNQLHSIMVGRDHGFTSHNLEFVLEPNAFLLEEPEEGHAVAGVERMMEGRAPPKRQQPGQNGSMNGERHRRQRHFRRGRRERPAAETPNRTTDQTGEEQTASPVTTDTMDI